ncbi:hypothetical protein EYR36_002009 [Pleurotus pulmonarius]|nr:hypothetical protein EYR36_002009 [Pleurotus pulmonarius]
MVVSTACSSLAEVTRWSPRLNHPPRTKNKAGRTKKMMIYTLQLSFQKPRRPSQFTTIHDSPMLPPLRLTYMPFICVANLEEEDIHAEISSIVLYTHLWAQGICDERFHLRTGKGTKKNPAPPPQPSNHFSLWLILSGRKGNAVMVDVVAEQSTDPNSPPNDLKNLHGLVRFSSKDRNTAEHVGCVFEDMAIVKGLTPLHVLNFIRIRGLQHYTFTPCNKGRLGCRYWLYVLYREMESASLVAPGGGNTLKMYLLRFYNRAGGRQRKNTNAWVRAAEHDWDDLPAGEFYAPKCKIDISYCLEDMAPVQLNNGHRGKCLLTYLSSIKGWSILGAKRLIGGSATPRPPYANLNVSLSVASLTATIMDFLHSQLRALQRNLAFVATDAIPWKLYVQAFSWTVALFESYLILRQYPLYSKTEPPAALASYFSKDEFLKSQNYGKDKAKFSLFSGLYKQCIDSALLQFGFYAWSWTAAGKVTSWFGYGPDYEITQSLIFAFLLFFISSIPSLPLSVYSTFVLEEKHGFNKTTPAVFVTDLLKGWAIGIVLGAPFLALFLYIFEWAGDRFVPWLMGFMISFQMIMVVLYPTVIQPLFNKLSPLAEGDLRTRIEALAGKLKFPLKHLYEIDGSKRSSHSNAYFFGLPWSKHIVIFDTLIQQSKPEEVEAVLAHELGHWYFLHPTKMLAISQLHTFAVLATFPAFMHAPPVLRAFDFPKAVAAQPPTIVAFLLFQMILTPVEAVVSICLNAVSRHFEWQADRFACELQDQLQDPSMSDMGDRLGRALITLHVKNLSTVWVDWLYSAYHHSHPTLTERLKAMETFQTAREKKAL